MIVRLNVKFVVYIYFCLFFHQFRNKNSIFPCASIKQKKNYIKNVVKLYKFFIDLCGIDYAISLSNNSIINNLLSIRCLSLDYEHFDF